MRIFTSLATTATTIAAALFAVAPAAHADEPSVAAANASNWIPDGYYRVAYDGGIWYVDSANDQATLLSPQDWSDAGFPAFKPAPTDYVHYPWSPAIYAVTFFGPDHDQWLWEHLTGPEWQAAGNPAPRVAGWIEGTDWEKCSGTPAILATDDGVDRHILSYAEWAAAGAPAPTAASDCGYFRFSWDRSGSIFFSTQGIISGSDLQRYSIRSGVVTTYPWTAQTTYHVSYGEWAQSGFTQPQTIDQNLGATWGIIQDGSIYYQVNNGQSPLRKHLTLAEYQASYPTGFVLILNARNVRPTENW